MRPHRMVVGRMRRLRNSLADLGPANRLCKQGWSFQGRLKIRNSNHSKFKSLMMFSLGVCTSCSGVL